MKNLIVIIVFFMLALIIGCQGSMLNEPADVLMKTGDNHPTSSVVGTSNTLKLNYNLRDHEGGTCMLTGRVTYVHQVINRGMDPLSSKVIALHLNIDASLCDLAGIAHLEWRIRGKSDDLVSVSEEGILLLEKSYSITNRHDVVLLVKYLVTTDGVGIASVNLVPIERKY